MAPSRLRLPFGLLFAVMAASIGGALSDMPYESLSSSDDVGLFMYLEDPSHVPAVGTDVTLSEFSGRHAILFTVSHKEHDTAVLLTTKNLMPHGQDQDFESEAGGTWTPHGTHRTAARTTARTAAHPMIFRLYLAEHRGGRGGAEAAAAAGGRAATAGAGAESGRRKSSGAEAPAGAGECQSAGAYRTPPRRTLPLLCTRPPSQTAGTQIG
jgi:hypothetical protein